MNTAAEAASALPLIIFGASGQVGRSVLARCAARGQPVLALSRAPPRPEAPGRRWLQARLPDAVPVLPPAAALLSLGPLDGFSTWLQSQPAAPGGAAAVVALSSMSAQSKRDSPAAGERALAARLRAAEAGLAAWCDARGLRWTVLRPTLLWGAGLDHSLSPLARRAARWHLMPRPRAAGLRQPVHVDDVAAAALAALDRPAAAGAIIPCGGGERLPASALFARVHASLPRAALGVPLPRWLSRVARSLARHDARLAAVARLEQDLVADNAALAALLDIHPRAFRPRATDWETPPV